ncbi:proteoglycan 4a [Electrophorus electricus]|uniref:proteoglycan 4a n=1 Tax=Electrophorus electricus TaxID=8005 RepID=UPI0015D08973|nr:proteoglycan 4a [Electrophorus electricus]
MACPSVIASLLLVVCILLPLTCVAQGSCKGRCGEPFSRGQPCNCDANCLTYKECCKDYEDICTIRHSCRGRCRETFRRGRECDCDPDCTLFNNCCLDYLGHCDLDQISAAARSAQNNLKPTEYVEDLADPVVSTISPDAGLYSPLLPANPGSSTPGADTNSPISAAGPPHTGDASSGKTISIPLKVSLSFSEHTGEAPASGTGRPSTLADITQALEAGGPAGLPESSNPDLCNGLPIDGVTSLFNGSIIVFRGHFFWLLNPQTRVAGPARNITDELGVPSPIDTVFTRCNCQAKTYIIKNDKYWSFENGVMEPGYPRSLSNDFGGLSGEISAALPVPSSRKRPEVIYFFKKGSTVQKLSYPARSSPRCSGKTSRNSIYTRSHQASSEGASPSKILLSGEISINLNWKGFPTPVTSALSIPNPRKPDGFEYFIISWPKLFSIKISGENPSLVSPTKLSGQQIDVRGWLNCPQQP